MPNTHGRRLRQRRPCVGLLGLNERKRDDGLENWTFGRVIYWRKGQCMTTDATLKNEFGNYFSSVT